MARCRCAEESACTCVINAGPGIVVSGSGAPSSPWTITATANAVGTMLVLDTPSVDMDLAGTGTLADPHIISARVLLDALIGFIDTTTGVNFTVTGAGIEGDPMSVRADIPLIDLATVPTIGSVLAFVNGHYTPVPPVTVAPGLIVTGPALTGDGSLNNPLNVDICTYAELKAACATP